MQDLFLCPHIRFDNWLKLAYHARMSLMTIFLIALGLSMDAFAVSMSNGLSLKCFRIRSATLIALFYGGFQAIMPVLGWFAGKGLQGVLSRFAPWIAFALLVFIGAKMIYEAHFLKDEESKSCNPEKLLVVFTLAIATSIDALAVGFSFAMLDQSVLIPVLIIGLVTFVLSYFGVWLGNRFGSKFGNKIEILGGLILIGIGIKILIESFA